MRNQIDAEKCQLAIGAEKLRRKKTVDAEKSGSKSN